MRSHYKRIGDYITLVKLKNSDGAISSLKGININKHFMPSVANVNGTDLSTYRVVKKNQFAFNPMHVGRDEVLPISMLEDDEPIIVSPAYVVFEVNDEEELLPAYLMMWCRRAEFDRNAWFMTDNSVRGGFSWADFYDMELPIPSIEKQREIVREYNVVNDRILLHEQLIKKLEDTAKTIYKQWFVEFEFPISKEYAQSIGKPELEGQSYKSSGRDLVYCEVLGSEIPSSWRQGTLEQLVSFSNGKKKPSEVGEYPIYGGNGVLGYAVDWNYQNILAIGRVGHYCGSLFRVFGKCWISDNAICGKSLTNHNNFCYYLLNSLKLNEKSEGTGQPLLTQGILKSIPIALPQNGEISAFEKIADKIFSLMSLYQSEVVFLTSLRSTLLSKMTKF